MAGGIGMGRLLRRPTSNAREVVPCMILTLHAQVWYKLKEGWINTLSFAAVSFAPKSAVESWRTTKEESRNA